MPGSAASLETTHPHLWVLDDDAGDGTLERIGDARTLADRLGGTVGALAVAPAGHPIGTLAAHGAQHIVHVVTPGDAPASLGTRVAAACEVLGDLAPRLVLASGDVRGREWAATLCVRVGWTLLSPALLASARAGDLEVTVLGPAGLARRVRLPPDTTGVATLAPGVGEARTAEPAASAEVVIRPIPEVADPVRRRRLLPADPASVDIRHARRLVAGGRGVGSREGFERLRRFAERIGAGVAASRMAVDLGWIEAERQVGQTGRTVAPDLYLACGISGASHHLEGMAGSRAVVAINTDPAAPIFAVAHLGLVGDLHAILERVEAELDAPRSDAS